MLRLGLTSTKTSFSSANRKVTRMKRKSKIDAQFGAFHLHFSGVELVPLGSAALSTVLFSSLLSTGSAAVVVRCGGASPVSISSQKNDRFDGHPLII